MTKIFNYEDEMVSFTKEGEMVAIQIYDLTKQGVSIEEIEDTFNLQKMSSDGVEHIEYRIIMAVGKLTGLHETFDAVEAVYSTLDEIEITGEVI